MIDRPQLHLALALEAGGWHPAAMHGDGPPSADYWTNLALEAERGLLDFLTFEDVLAPHPSGSSPAPGRLDAPLLATWAAARTAMIGVVPTLTVTHAEPFHTATAIATLDQMSDGRAGYRVRVSGRRQDSARVGRQRPDDYDIPDLADPGFLSSMADRFDQAAEHVEVANLFWDGRVDFTGRWYRAEGRPVTVRSPQIAPPVTVLAHMTTAYRLAARVADLVYVTPRDGADARAIVAEIRTLRAEAGRKHDPLPILGELVVFLDATPDAAAARKARLDAEAGAEFVSDASIFTGTPAELADLMEEWCQAGLAGFRLRPGAVPADVPAITRELVPQLRARGLFRKKYETGTLRERLGLALVEGPSA
ncbi:MULTISPECIES: LLM class flavin-dependent oxidoreductase [unclassified Nonomuraea]|uniref:LLM class flavin-dependent oxidoreductase n=1 Tax=unclassified Nonomuraea TaxID=2593643 RepID=UPI0033EBFFCC